MRKSLYLLAALLSAVGCSRSASPPAPGRVQINQTSMYVSANPIRPGVPVTFWHELSPQRKTMVQQTLSNPVGSAGLTVQPAASQPVALSTVPVTAAHMVRKVAVKQGGALLYAKEDIVTPVSLDALSAWTITSDQWASVPLTSGDVEFSMEYWRFWESPQGNGGECTVRDSAMIPIAGAKP